MSDQPPNFNYAEIEQSSEVVDDENYSGPMIIFPQFGTGTETIDIPVTGRRTFDYRYR